MSRAQSIRDVDPEHWIPHASASYDDAVVANEVNWRKLCALTKTALENARARGDVTCTVDVVCFGEFMIHRMRNLLSQKLYRIEFSYADGPVHNIHHLRISFDLSSMYARARELMAAISRARAEGRTSCTVTMSNTLLKELEWVAMGLRNHGNAVSIRPCYPAGSDAFSDSGDDDDPREHAVSVSWK